MLARDAMIDAIDGSESSGCTSSSASSLGLSLFDGAVMSGVGWTGEDNAVAELPGEYPSDGLVIADWPG